MEYVTSEQMSKINRLTMDGGVSLVDMLELAGEHLADFVYRKLSPKKVVIIYGKGNNGAGGLVAAKYLRAKGVKTVIVGASKDNGESVKAQLKIIEDLEIESAEEITECNVIIDALLGYNINGNPNGKYADLINEANKFKDNGAKIVSFDLPSGINPDSGECYDPCINADYTLTIALPKIGLKNAKGKVGRLYLININIPEDVYRRLDIKIEKYFNDDDVIEI